MAGENSIYFDHPGECRDPETRWHCPGRWRGVVSLKTGPDGQRRRKKVSGKTTTEVRAKLAELNDGVVTHAGYTVAHAIRDWLADGLAGRALKTVSIQREGLAVDLSDGQSTPKGRWVVPDEAGCAA